MIPISRHFASTVSQAGAAALLLTLALAGPAPAAEAGFDALSLARNWDHVNFELKDNAVVETQAQALVRQAQAAAKANPEAPAPVIWEAMAFLAKADARRNLSSIPLAEHARRLLEKAVEMGVQGDDAGFAEAVLGTLYAETPGFPFGFGDRKKARAWFAKALAAAPDDIDVQVLWGDFLLKQKDYAGAIDAAKRALDAPPRPGREIGDRYRREEARKLLAQAQAHER